MTGYIYLNQQISSRSAVGSRLTFFTDTDTLAIVDTGRYRYLDLLSGRSISGSTAGTAFVLDHLTGSVTVRTGLYIYAPFQTWTAVYKQPDLLHDISDRLPVKWKRWNVMHFVTF